MGALTRLQRSRVLVATSFAVASTTALVMGCNADPSLNAQSAYNISATTPVGFDRKLAQTASVTHLSNLIAINTQNPPVTNSRLLNTSTLSLQLYRGSNGTCSMRAKAEQTS